MLIRQCQNDAKSAAHDAKALRLRVTTDEDDDRSRHVYDTVRQFKFETPTWTAYFFYSCIMSQSCCAMYETGFRTAAINVIERSPSLRVAAHLIGVSKASLSRWSKRIVPRAWHKTPSTRVLRVIDIVRHLLRNLLLFDFIVQRYRLSIRHLRFQAAPSFDPH